MSEAIDQGIKSYCYQVCGSVGSAMCGTGRICQEGIDVVTQMPAEPEHLPDYGPSAPEAVMTVCDLNRRAQQLEANDGLPGIALAGAIRAMTPYWNIHARNGASREDILGDLRSAIKEIQLCLDLEQIEF